MAADNNRTRDAGSYLGNRVPRVEASGRELVAGATRTSPGLVRSEVVRDTRPAGETWRLDLTRTGRPPRGRFEAAQDTGALSWVWVKTVSRVSDSDLRKIQQANAKKGR